MIVASVILVVLGLSLGSFVNAAVWRIRQQSLASTRKLSAKRGKRKNQFSILYGRSQCVYCGHRLAGRDLVPVVSWLILRGRCRYCQKPISWQYPEVEVVMALVFVVSYLFWPGNFSDPGQRLLFVTWLAVSVGLLALAIYDLKWMLLPNRILYPAFFFALAGRLAYILFFGSDKVHLMWLLTLSVLMASGIFWLIFYVSRGAWIGYGDVRLGLVTGVLLADPALSLLMIFVASLLGSLVAIPRLLTGHGKLATRLPYGPFLISAALFCLLWGNQIIQWYRSLFLA